MPKYSIIVPVYQAEATIRSCVESVFAQTVGDWELILVNDGSTDQTAEVCRELKNKDSRVRTIHKENNQRQAAARNDGLSVASGEYILFMDADDYVESNLLEDLDAILKEHAYPLVTWGIFNDIHKSDGTVAVSESPLNATENREVTAADNEDWLALYFDTFFASPCNKLYRRDLIEENHLRFEPICVDFEDYEFNVRYCRHLDSFCISAQAYYHYNQPEHQVAPLKRRWGEVTPYAVSNLIFRTTDEFIARKSQAESPMDRIMLYVYKSFMNEFEYAYRTKNMSDFVRTVRKACASPEFLNTLQRAGDYGIRRFAELEIFLLRRKWYTLGALLIWLMQKKDIG